MTRVHDSGPSDAASHVEAESQGFGSDAWSLTQLEASLARPHGISLLARDEQTGRVRGACLGWCVAGEAELERIVVVPSGRRAGCGGLLLDEFLERCRAGSGGRVFLEVRSSNEAAIGLYLSRAFSEVGRRRRYYRDGEDAVIMALDLS